MIDPHGIVSVKHIRNGEVLAEETKGNVTCNAGVTLLVNIATGVGSFTPVYGTQFQWIAIGTGTTTVSAADTTLTAQFASSAYTSYNLGTVSVANDTAQMTVSFPFITLATINEAGLFSGTATNPGTYLLGHVIIGPFVCHAGDILQVQWNETF